MATDGEKQAHRERTVRKDDSWPFTQLHTMYLHFKTIISKQMTLELQYAESFISFK